MLKRSHNLCEVRFGDGMVTLPRKKKARFACAISCGATNARGATSGRCCSARVQRMERISNVIDVPFYVRKAQLLSSISMLLRMLRQGCKTFIIIIKENDSVINSSEIIGNTGPTLLIWISEGRSIFRLYSIFYSTAYLPMTITKKYNTWKICKQ